MNMCSIRAHFSQVQSCAQLGSSINFLASYLLRFRSRLRFNSTKSYCIVNRWRMIKISNVHRRAINCIVNSARTCRRMSRNQTESGFRAYNEGNENVGTLNNKTMFVTVKDAPMALLFGAYLTEDRSFRIKYYPCILRA